MSEYPVPDNSRHEEDAYFRERERELLESQRRADEVRAARAAMGRVIGVEDDGVLLELQHLGYDAETVRVLPLLPLIRVAWSEGVVTGRERDAILEAAKSRGVEPGTPAYKKVEFWLEEPPRDPVYQPSLRLLGRIVRLGGKQGNGMNDIIAACTKVATVSGGFFGFGTGISEVERIVIERIRTALEEEPAP